MVKCALFRLGPVSHGSLVALCCIGFAVTATATTITTNTFISTSDATYDGAALTVDGAQLTIDGAHGFTELRLTNGATLTHTAGTAGFHLTVSGDVAVDATSLIDVSSKGRSSGTGYGAGSTVGTSYGSGAGHGGRGGGTMSGPSPCGTAYGVSTHPLLPGSGGGRTVAGGVPGGTGGGAIHLDVHGALFLDGEVRANGGAGGSGQYGRSGGGGSGGSIWLTAGMLSGLGSIHADGGNSGLSSDLAGGGSGGRIALYYATIAFDTQNITAFHGDGAPAPEDGSIHISTNSPPAYVVDLLPNGTLDVAVSQLTIAFVSAIDASTFTLDDVAITGPANCAVHALTMIDAQTVALEFSPALDAAGQYHISVGPHVVSSYGGEMDQDRDGLPGEASDDVYVDSFILATHVFDASTPITISTDFVISADDTTYDHAPLTIDHALLTIDGAHAFADLILTNGATLTHTASTPGLFLSVSNDMTISSNSTIDLTGKGFEGVGYADGLGQGAGHVNWGGGSGGGHGGDGAASVAVSGGMTCGYIKQPVALGSSAGSGSGWPGGAGGGAIRVDVGGTLALDGAIRSDGLYGGGNAGGGAGGSVWLHASLFQGCGVITANGGGLVPQSPSAGGGGGGGGRIAVEYNTSHFIGSLTAFGGFVRRGGAGTIYLRDLGESDGALHVVADESNTPLATTTLSGNISLLSLTLSTGANVHLGSNTLLTASALIVTNGVSSLAVPALSDLPPVFGEVMVHAGASLSLPLPRYTHEWSLKLRVTGDVRVDADGAITVTGKGYAGGSGGSLLTSGHGPGGGLPGWYVGSGGGHGGAGGTSSYLAPGGSVYGQALYPTSPGSGGGAAFSGGGTAGGGVIWLMVDGDLLLDGTVEASGDDYLYGMGSSGSGAGGSVFICARSLIGLGRIAAAGGDGYSSPTRFSGGGGGGRVAIYAELDGFATSNISVAAGAFGNPPGGTGSYHHATSAPPASISAVLPAGYVTQTLNTITLVFDAPIDLTSFSTDDMVLSGPQSAAVEAISPVDATTFTLTLDTTLTVDGTYQLAIGPTIASFAGGLMDVDADGVPGEVPADRFIHSFTIDRTPPQPPVISNFVGLPATNLVATTLPSLSGTKDADSSVWRDERQLADAGGGTWSNRAPLLTGLTALSLKSIDPAGNASDPTNLLFLADIVAPRIVVTVPANGAVVGGQPSIEITCREGASGLDLERSELMLLCNDNALPGQWAQPTPGRLCFESDAGLPEGFYRLDVTLYDRAGLNSGLQTSSFEIDRTGPAAPIIDPVTTPTEASSQLVHGTKPAQTALLMNGAEIEALSDATTWTVDVALPEEVNRLTFYCEDAIGNPGSTASVIIVHLVDTPPEWWHKQAIIVSEPSDANDWAALNVGQLKWMAYGAANTFDEALPWGPGVDVTALVDDFSNGQSFAAVNVGQLKHVATPFYDRLGLQPPWLVAPLTNDWALANVGQLKQLFDLRPTRDWDDDGLPNWWEDLYWGDSEQQDDEGDEDGDGLTNLDEFFNHSDPTRIDSDLDGVDDPTEIARGSDPSDAASFPVNITGTITYGGGATGPVRVVASSGATPWAGLIQQVGALPADYVLSNAVSDVTYAINAWMDVDEDGACDIWEPTGSVHGFPRTLLLGATGADILLTHPDSDGDGMDDLWEMDKFGTLLPDGATDSDGDGLSNREEFEQGYNPMSPDGPALSLPPAATFLPGEIGLTIFTPQAI
ncbi:MAG: hypothetical protein HQ523_01710 [Lentisphaerae bacterium]|nr:hypothetical protein [Lentisphaerota bacterium]